MFELPPLALALTGLPTPAGVRKLIDGVPAAGFRAVAIDATHPETRPRSLDASARRDLASLLRRSELAFAGLDLWIPPEHFTSPANADRAADAVAAACGLAVDLARGCGGASAPLVSILLPPEPLEGVVSALAAAAERFGAGLADHARPVRTLAARGFDVGLDPAMLLLADADPAREASTLLRQGRLSAARLSDAGPAGRVHVGAPGSRLDVLAYSVSLVTGGYREFVTLDLRGLPDPELGARAALAAWRDPTHPH